ncbi:hypothetical protein VEE05_13710 [Escherichia coli]|nr:hypothetical protein VEGS05_14480 [Escherichia coli]BEA15653.1 hypothetical protein VEE05_13710 [Escherichia coli]BED17196.1 hypothetical protein VEE78_14290 [Escherichia coli]
MFDTFSILNEYNTGIIIKINDKDIARSFALTSNLIESDIEHIKMKFIIEKYLSPEPGLKKAGHCSECKDIIGLISDDEIIKIAKNAMDLTLQSPLIIRVTTNRE